MGYKIISKATGIEPAVTFRDKEVFYRLNYASQHQKGSNKFLESLFDFNSLKFYKRF